MAGSPSGRWTGVTKEAVARAEALLLENLTPEQAEDWERTKQFNVRGSSGALYRVRPEYGTYGCSVVLGPQREVANVWPVCLDIPADRALALLFFIQGWESKVLRTGCRDVVTRSVTMPTDYHGKL